MQNGIPRASSLPPPAETGRRRSWPMRELMNALFIVLCGGCPLAHAAGDFPPHRRPIAGLTRFLAMTEPGRMSELTTGDAGSRTCRPRIQPQCGDYRQPELSKPRKPVDFGLWTLARRSTGANVKLTVDTDGRVVDNLRSMRPRSRIAMAKHILCCRFRASVPFIERVFADSAYAADRVATATRIHRRESRQAGWPNRLCRASPALGGRTLWPGSGATAVLAVGDFEGEALESAKVLFPPMPLPSCCSYTDRTLFRSA